MIDYREYTKFRDIAVKRIKRMSAKGIQADYFPMTVKQLRANPAIAEIESIRLSSFLMEGPSLARRQESRRIKKTPEQRRLDKQKANREYRRRKVAKELEQKTPGHEGKYQAYLKGIKTLGVDIPPSKLPAFFQYMDYRFAQGNTAGRYLFDVFLDDYTQMLQKGYKPDQILKDFQKFESDQLSLSARASKMEGIDVDLALDLWTMFVGM